MTIFYYDSETEVLVGDHIEYKLWLFFWRGWRPARVTYVPGISPKNSELERDGLRWVGIKDTDDDTQTASFVDLETGQIQPHIRFVRRADDGLTETRKGFYFGDEVS